MLILLAFDPTAHAFANEREKAIISLMEKLKSDELGVVEARLNGLQETYLNTSLARDKRLASLALGIHYVESDQKLAIQYLTAAEREARPGDDLLSIIRYYLALA